MLQSGEAGCYWKDAALHPSCPHTNCHTHGYFMKGAGQALTISVDTSLAAAAGSSVEEAGSSVEEAGSSASNVVQFARRYLVVKYIQGKNFSRGGDAVLACVRGCRCSSITLALQLYPVLGIAAVEVSTTVAPGQLRCMLQLAGMLPNEPERLQETAQALPGALTCVGHAASGSGGAVCQSSTSS